MATASTFESWLKYQAVDMSTLSADELADWKKTYSEVTTQDPKRIADDLRMAFFERGRAYYLSGRATFLSGIHADLVAGNLFHHAVEMCLKGCLCPDFTADELKAKFGHQLGKLWGEFMAKEPWRRLMRTTAAPELDAVGKALAGFQPAVADLNAFEDLRYPDKVPGFTAIIGRERVADPVRLKGPPSPRLFRLFLNEVDRLIVALHTAGSVNPVVFTMGLNAEGLDLLKRENPVAGAWDGQINLPPF
jgi:hypothetical protein